MKQLDEIYVLMQRAKDKDLRSISLTVNKHDKDRYKYIFDEFVSVGYRTSFNINDFQHTNRIPVVMEW